MMGLSPIFLAAADGPALDLVIWIVAGVIWFISQLANASRRKGKKSRDTAPAPPSSAPETARGIPTPDELAEIFKRLGANIPSTPPPPAPATPPPPPGLARQPPPPPVPQKTRHAHVTIRKPQAPVHPEIARRLARAKQEAAEAARRADAPQVAVHAMAPAVESRAGENRALDTATRHTGAILPRLYAMSMRLTALPGIPMPELDRSRHTHARLRTRLHSRRELREALMAQMFLQPPRSE